MQLQPLADAQRGRGQLSGIKLGEYAKGLKAVLAPMPEADPTVPGWLKSVDTLFETLQIPEDIRGVILLPFLNEKMRAFVASESDGSVMPYPELKEKILKELKMTPNEYRRLFLSVKTEQGDSWHQVATKLETLFSYYLKSRDVTTLQDIKDLVIADRFKQILSEEVRTYVMQNEVKAWLVTSEIAELAETYEESRRVGGSQKRSDNPLHEGDRRVVDADLLYVPLSLAGKDGCSHRQVLTLCAVTEVLSQGLDALLTPEAHELLERAKRELDDEAQDRATLEQAVITTVNTPVDWSAWGPEFGEKAEEDTMVASVGLAVNETMG
ncbi:hypothetical protein HPB49_025595 [Dermacentor silvarum]|uniref:Uncharacterized protein n=1 Tax=Dermacentor silvarum TaxID=543639 RepID=A0ACB8E4M9_DERSI|nr:hypothetical protein HPB49_025595 [Dermacentor silvarum]